MAPSGKYIQWTTLRRAINALALLPLLLPACQLIDPSATPENESYSLSETPQGAREVGKAGDVVFMKIPLSAVHKSDKNQLLSLAFQKAHETLETAGVKNATPLSAEFKENLTSFGPKRLKLIMSLKENATDLSTLLVGLSFKQGEMESTVHFALIEPWMRVSFDSLTKKELGRQQRIDVLECNLPASTLSYVPTDGALLGMTSETKYPCGTQMETDEAEIDLAALPEQGTALIARLDKQKGTPIAMITTLTGGFVQREEREKK